MKMREIKTWAGIAALIALTVTDAFVFVDALASAAW